MYDRHFMGIRPGYLVGVLVFVISLMLLGNADQRRVEAQPVKKDVVKQAQQRIDNKSVQMMFQGYQQGSSMHLRAEAIGEFIRKFVGYQVTVKTATGLAGVMGFLQGKLNMYLTLSPHSITKESLQREAPDLVQKYKETLIIPTYEKFEILLVLERVKGSSLADLLARKYLIKMGFGGINPGIVVEKIFQAYGVSLKDIESWGVKRMQLREPAGV